MEPYEGKLVSVIVPVYKVEKYLTRCLDSICNQTYRNLEIILIDDGSSDYSGSVCDCYAEKDCRIRVIHKQNAGVSAARNDGLDVATGDYITFVDSDDYIAPEMYEKLVFLITGETADIAVCGYYQEDINGEFHINWKGTDEVCLNQVDQIECLLKNRYYTCSLCDKLFRRELLTAVRLDERIHHYEDYLFLYEVMKQSKMAVFSPEGMYYYCNNPQSAARSAFNTKTMEIVDVCDMVRKDVALSFPSLKKCAQTEYVRINIMCSMFAAEANSRDKNAIHRLKKNIRRCLLRYLMSYASRGYKVCAILIALNWRLFRLVKK